MSPYSTQVCTYHNCCKMSSAKGSMNRQRPQKHQNRTAFKNNLHDTSTKTKFLNSMDVSGVCQKCKNIIEWKIKYKKYKSLTAPKKCVGCEQKTVKHNYHVLCNKCAREKDVCAKCYKKAEVGIYLHTWMHPPIRLDNN